MANPMKAIKAVKKITAGKAKVNRKVEKIDTIADARTGGNLSYMYKKGKLIEKFDNHSPIKTKPRALTKRLNQMAPDRKQTLKLVRKVTPKKPGIPVKKRGK
jgi:hypothetical protein